MRSSAKLVDQSELGAGATSPNAKRVEYRTPDPSGNPYITFAAILLAGLDGIRKNLKPPDPVDEDIYEYDRVTLKDDIVKVKEGSQQ